MLRITTSKRGSHGTFITIRLACWDHKEAELGLHRGVPAAGAASHVRKYGVDWRGCRSVSSMILEAGRRTGGSSNQQGRFPSTTTIVPQPWQRINTVTPYYDYCSPWSSRGVDCARSSRPLALAAVTYCRPVLCRAACRPGQTMPGTSRWFGSCRQSFLAAVRGCKVGIYYPTVYLDRSFPGPAQPIR